MHTELVMSERRALRRIERDLVRSDPQLNALFLSITGLGRGKEEMPATEQIGSKPLWPPARRGWRVDRSRGK
jgi:hypothetical protein